MQMYIIIPPPPSLHLLTLADENLKTFTLRPSKGYQPVLEILPPPSFSNTVMQHTYYYRQNPAIKKALIAGKPALQIGRAHV